MKNTEHNAWHIGGIQQIHIVIAIPLSYVNSKHDINIHIYENI